MKNRLLKISLCILTLLFLLAGGFFFYLRSYYPADETAAALSRSSNIYQTGACTILEPDAPADTGIIFYPGAKVEGNAYLPLLDQLRDQGYACILVNMPFHMAFFNVNGARDAMEQLPQISSWYICGHSLGGAMASTFASKNPQSVDGLILLGAYIYGDYPVEDALTIYGSLNAGVGEKIDYTENIVVIDGGNHAQFGNYGPQKGDLPALISAEEQQAQTVAAITEFIESRQTSIR